MPDERARLDRMGRGRDLVGGGGRGDAARRFAVYAERRRARRARLDRVGWMPWELIQILAFIAAVAAAVLALKG